MLQLHESIRQRRIALHMSQEELAHACGYTSRSSIAKIEKGETDISQAKIKLFAKALKCTPAELMGWTDPAEERRSNINEVFALGLDNVTALPQTKKIPLLGNIACGEPITAVENRELDLSIPAWMNADFALTCKGDSMIDARIYDGDMVLIHIQPEVENGEIAAVLIDGEATLKRVYYQTGKLILQPANTNYPPLVYTNDDILDIRILGKAVHFIGKVK